MGTGGLFSWGSSVAPTRSYPEAVQTALISDASLAWRFRHILDSGRSRGVASRLSQACGQRAND